jgi:hypothetical protein
MCFGSTTLQCSQDNLSGGDIWVERQVMENNKNYERKTFQPEEEPEQSPWGWDNVVYLSNRKPTTGDKAQKRRVRK